MNIIVEVPASLTEMYIEALKSADSGATLIPTEVDRDFRIPLHSVIGEIVSIAGDIGKITVCITGVVNFVTTIMNLKKKAPRADGKITVVYGNKRIEVNEETADEVRQLIQAGRTDDVN